MPPKVKLPVQDKSLLSPIVLKSNLPFNSPKPISNPGNNKNPQFNGLSKALLDAKKQKEEVQLKPVPPSERNDKPATPINNLGTNLRPPPPKSPSPLSPKPMGTPSTPTAPSKLREALDTSPHPNLTPNINPNSNLHPSPNQNNQNNNLMSPKRGGPNVGPPQGKSTREQRRMQGSPNQPPNNNLNSPLQNAMRSPRLQNIPTNKPNSLQPNQNLPQSPHNNPANPPPQKSNSPMNPPTIKINDGDPQKKPHPNPQNHPNYPNQPIHPNHPNHPNNKLNNPPQNVNNNPNNIHPNHNNAPPNNLNNPNNNLNNPINNSINPPLNVPNNVNNTNNTSNYAPNNAPNNVSNNNNNNSNSNNNNNNNNNVINFVKEENQPAESSEAISKEIEELANLLLQGKMQQANKLLEQKFKIDGYEGDIKNGRPHGKGKFVFRNGDQYEGDFLYAFKIFILLFIDIIGELLLLLILLFIMKSVLL